MSNEVKTYKIKIYGSPSGYGNNRAEITLYDESNNLIAWVWFRDPDMPFPEDYVYDYKIRMYLPTSMFQSVLDILRNEKPIFCYFFSNKGRIYTGAEEAGEEEIEKGPA